jgi:hypothetical protein
LIGETCNRDAIGSWVELKVGKQVMRRQVMPTRSYLSQCELPVAFGLGKETKIDQAEIQWSDGSRQIFPVPEVDRLYVVNQPGSSDSSNRADH